MSRSLWMLSQCVIVAALVLALAPQRALFSVLPSIEVSRSATQAGERAPLLAQALGDEEDTVHAAEQAGWLDLLARGWLMLYAGGVLAAGARVLAGQRTLGALLAGARRLTPRDIEQHGAFARTGSARAALPVWETEAPVSPMLVGLLQPCLVLPRHLRDFPLEQQQLIIAHELTHLQRRDPLWLHISIVLQTLLWFNPLLRRIGERLVMAQELGCDRDVLAGRAQPTRQQYAAALVTQLKLQQIMPGALAFGDGQAVSMAERIGMIRKPAPARHDPIMKAALALLLTGVLAASAMLQPAFAWRADTASSLSAPRGDAPLWQTPLAQARVSSFFGVPRKGLPNGHNGIDFAARTGVPVFATADGVVLDSTDLYAGGAKYGKVIVIEHANKLRSIYAHLDQRQVATGATVTAGQQIGLVGATGKATGPHLHLEAFREGQRIDPATMFADLDQRAFPKALAARDAARR